MESLVSYFATHRNSITLPCFNTDFFIATRERKKYSLIFFRDNFWCFVTYPRTSSNLQELQTSQSKTFGLFRGFFPPGFRKASRESRFWGKFVRKLDIAHLVLFFYAKTMSFFSTCGYHWHVFCPLVIRHQRDVVFWVKNVSIANIAKMFLFRAYCAFTPFSMFSRSFLSCLLLKADRA